MVWKTLFKAIGLGVCFIQIFTIAESYLAFNVVSKVTVKPAKHVTLPGFTVCSPLYDFWSEKVVRKYANQIPGLENADFRSFLRTTNGRLAIKEFITRMTVSEIRSTVGQSAENFLQVYHVLNPETGLFTRDRSQDFMTQSFLLQGKLCQMIYPKNPELYTYSIRSLSGNRFGASMISYLVGGGNINASSNSIRAITLTTPGKLPFGPPGAFELITQDEQRYAYALKYKISIAERMPPPYKTNCKNYTEDGLESEEELYQNCLNEIASREWRSTAPGTLVPLNAAGHLKYENVPLVGAEGKQWKEALHYCEKKASQQACKAEHYTITSVAKIKMFRNQSFIHIIPPYEPIIVTMDFPMMTTLDFIVSIGSTFGYWMGFNVVAASISSVLYCQKYGSLVKEKLNCKCKSSEIISAKPRVFGFVTETDVIKGRKRIITYY